MNVYSVDSGPDRPLFRAYALLFRVLSWTAAFLYLGQAVLAGQFLSGTYPALRLHQIGATTSDLVLCLAIVAAALLRWHAGARIWPFWAGLGLLGANQVQNGAGAARWIHLHIPLGTAMLAIAVVVAVAASRAPLRPGTADGPVPGAGAEPSEPTPAAAGPVRPEEAR